MNWNILQRWKFFHFWWKIFHFGEFFFSASRPSRLPNCIPDGRCGNFSTLVENFPLRKISKKKNIPKSHELEHSAEVENFPLLVENFQWKIFHFGKFFFQHLDLLVYQIAYEQEDVEIFPLQWKTFHFEKFPKIKKSYSKIT